jgi:hypothetical protein
MGILDEAIREHLELKRQHGAGDSELQQLEDEAFGQAERPGEEAADPAAEAPTQFMTQPEVPAEVETRREPTIADLQEPPPLREPEAQPSGEVAAEEPAPEETAVPAEEQSPMEHEIVEAAGPSTEERHAIAEQPTEFFDVEEELGSPTPTDEELVEEEIVEPRLAPTDPLAGLEEGEEAEVSVQGPAPDDDDEYDDEDDAFWNEQRLSDELDQALEAPPSEETEPEPELEPVSEPEPEPEPEHESEELPVVEEAAPEPVAEAEPEVAHHDEDVLEETPDFLEETPEDDQLWFEQKPPKDFDFDD